VSDYTGLRCKVTIKDEFVPIIEEMAEYGASWEEETLNYPQYSFFHQFIKNNYNANFIPNGVMMAVPLEWEETSYKDGFNLNFDDNTKLWSFQCNFVDRGVLKDFFNLILPNIVEQVKHLEVIHETSTKSSFYELVEGQIVLSQKQGLNY